MSNLVLVTLSNDAMQSCYICFFSIVISLIHVQYIIELMTIGNN